MRDGKPFLHAHAAFASRDGDSVGGHLLPGCTVFVGEVTIREMAGVDLERVPDPITGLALWPL
jgi:predicted DNA-binding protein with PD1-like motif